MASFARWRTRAACAGATSWRVAARRSSPCPARDRPSSSGTRAVPWGERALLTFMPPEELDAARTRTLIARALAAEAARAQGAPFFIDEVDGQPIDESPMAGPLRDAGFAR